MGFKLRKLTPSSSAPGLEDHLTTPSRLSPGELDLAHEDVGFPVGLRHLGLCLELGIGARSADVWTWFFPTVVLPQVMLDPRLQDALSTPGVRARQFPHLFQGRARILEDIRRGEEALADY